MGKKRAGIMLCYPFEESRWNKWNTWALTQPKLDGIRCRALLKEDKVVLLSSTEETIVSVPHINKELELFKQTFHNEGIFELDGELYNHNLAFEGILSITNRTTNLHPNHKLIEYHIFDHVSQEPFCNRISQLNSVFWRLCQYATTDKDRTMKLKPVVTTRVDNIEQITHSLANNCLAGYEGVVIRHPLGKYVRKRSVEVMKFKPHQSDVYEVVGTIEEESKDGMPKNRLGAIICMDDDGNTFKVGSGFTQKQRNELWHADLIGKMVEVRYQTRTERGIPRFGIFLNFLT